MAETLPTTGRGVDIVTEWNLKTGLRWIRKIRVLVDIVTEWNLKEGTERGDHWFETVDIVTEWNLKSSDLSYRFISSRLI